MEGAFAIQTNNLVKYFGINEVLMGSNMNVRRGSIYALLGANGAGKTTLFKLLTGLLAPTMGSVEILGKDMLKCRNHMLRKIGSLIEVPTFYEHLSAKQNLELHLDYMGVTGLGAGATLARVGLHGTDEKPVSKFSLGMRQRLGIARALIHQPQILILDEPINGLDPMGIREMRDLFLNLVKNEHMTILLSSHILSEIEHIADIVGVLLKGKIVQEVSLAQIRAQNNGSLEDYFFEVMSGGKQL